MQVGLTSYSSSAREKTAVISSVPAILMALTCQNTDAAAARLYLLLFNGTAAPTPGAIPNYPPIAVDPGKIVQVDVGAGDIPIFDASVGITACLSTTETYTAPGTNDGLFYAWFVPKTRVYA